MSESYSGASGGASIQTLRRALAGQAGVTVRSERSYAGGYDEVRPDALDPARTIDATPIEGSAIAARMVPGEPEAGFGAFLDGIQRSSVEGLVDHTLPVVHATVAAAIRVRDDRVMHTWGVPEIERAAYLPLDAAPPAIVAAIRAAGIAVYDTTRDGDPAGPDAKHPHNLTRAAHDAIRRRREGLEQQLARRWADTERRALYVDGGIRGLPDDARRESVVGVVKSHHHVYGGDGMYRMIAELPVGARTTAVGVDTRPRVRLATWYLRLRAGDGTSPFAGVVRIEVGDSTFRPERADAISRWVLAEREPVALPDSRWRVMAYGIRDCEEYLRAVSA